MLEIRLLGQFALLLDGSPLDIPSRPAQSLFAYLAMNGGVDHRREKLAGMLWPDSCEANARGYLRHALWLIRKALDTGGSSWRDFLESDDIGLRWRETGQSGLDAGRILEKNGAAGWSVEELIQIVSLFRGELLPGFYDEWTILERERVRLAFDRKMELLLEQLSAAGRWDDVREWAQYWISKGYAPELAYQALMIAHSIGGDLSSVAKVFAQCKDTLSSELGVTLSKSLQEMSRRLMSGETPLAPRSPPEKDDPEIAGVPPSPGACPYKGLEYFDIGDAGLFFGRQRLTQKLVSHLQQNHQLAVVGASGSGKSSILRAGLIPALQKSGGAPGKLASPWLVRILTPTAHPLDSLAACFLAGEHSTSDNAPLVQELVDNPRRLVQSVRELVAREKAQRLLLAVDQFEEVFSLCASEVKRVAFMDALLSAVSVEVEAPVSLVISMRADFYAHCSAYPALREMLSQHQVYIGPMRSEELRAAIEEPAVHNGWRFQAGLVDMLMRDSHGEPGALPLLSHALRQTWLRRSGRTLTLKGYVEAGGVRQSIARTAETVYLRRLDEQEQAIARHIFLRLIEFSEDGLATRRRVSLRELVNHESQSAAVELVLETLSDARLILLDENSIQLAHEALLHEWPRLGHWLDEDRQGLRVQSSLTQAARRWEAAEQDPSDLYTGSRLAAALEWAATQTANLSSSEWDFLTASQAKFDRETREQEVLRQRELDTAQHLAEAEKQRAEQGRKANRQLRIFSISLVFILLAILAITGIALRQGWRASQEAHRAKSRELAVASLNMLEIDPELSILLALESVTESQQSGLAVPLEAEMALHRSIQESHLRQVLRGHQDAVLAVNFSPDAKFAATASQDGTAILWDTVSGQPVRVLRGHHGAVADAEFHPQEGWLVTASHDNTAILWDITTGQVLHTFTGHSDWIERVAFSPDGYHLATASRDGTVRIWAVDTGREELVLSAPTRFMGLDYNPDGTLVAAGGLDGSIRVWETATGNEWARLAGHNGQVYSCHFSPDGKFLVSAGEDGTAKVWEIAGKKEIRTLTGHADSVMGADFSPDGNMVITSSRDRKVKLWEIDTGKEHLVFSGHTGAVYGISFSRDGKKIISGSQDGTARIWDNLPRQELLSIGVSGGARHVEFSPDNRFLAAGIGELGKIGVWDAVSGATVATLFEDGHTARVNSLAFSPDGNTLLSGGEDHNAVLWELATGVRLRIFAGHDLALTDVAFNPDGKTIATASQDWLVKTWDATSGMEQLNLSVNLEATSVAFSPDGSMLVTGSASGNLVVWGVTDGKKLLSLAGHTDSISDIAFSRDGKYLASASLDGTTRLWDIDTGREHLRLQDRTHVPVFLTYSPDQSRIATAGLDGTVRLWDTATGQQVLVFEQASHTRLTGVAFSPDGKVLAVSSEEAIQLYLTDLNDLVAFAEARRMRDFSPEECHQFLTPDKCAPAPVSSQLARAIESQPASRRMCYLPEVGGVSISYFSQKPYEGILKAAAENSWEVTTLEPNSNQDRQKYLERFLQANCELIIAITYGNEEEIRAAALTTPRQQFVLIEGMHELTQDNVWNQFYAADQAAFLAGYVSAAVTRTGKVGVFGGVNIPPVADLLNGFAFGVAYYNQRNQGNVQLLGWDLDTQEGAFIGSFCCQEEGRTAARQLIADGADIIFPLAGSIVLQGVSQAIQQQPGVLLVGVDEDWARDNPEYASITLTSVEKRLDRCIGEAIESVQNGLFLGGSHTGTLANGGVGLSPFYELESRVPQQVRAELAEIQARIISGEIQTKP